MRMKRMTKAEMKKRHLIWLQLGVSGIVSSILAVVMFVCFPHPSYDDLQTTEVIVSCIEDRVKVSNLRGNPLRCRITSSEGEAFIICCPKDPEIMEKISAGDTITIKHLEGWAHEITKEDELLVTYIDKHEKDKVGFFVFCLILAAGESFFIRSYFSSVKNDIRKQENRDTRIQKKYGEKSKIK